MKRSIERCALGAIAAVMLVAAMLMAAGCGKREDQVRTHPRDLETFAAKLGDLQVYETYELLPLSYGAGEKSVFLEARKKGRVEKPVTEAEKMEIAEAIFDEVGFRVPLELDIYELSEQPTITGKLTDMHGNRLLIVSTERDEGATDALWLGMAEDSVIRYNGVPVALADLKIGFEVQGWIAGAVMTSYPGQATGVKLEVTGEGTALTGDASGVVESITIGQQDYMQNVMIVDGQTFGLSESTRVITDEGDAELSDVKPGDSVFVWFAGYEAGIHPGRPMVTQIRIQSS